MIFCVAPAQLTVCDSYKQEHTSDLSGVGLKLTVALRISRGIPRGVQRREFWILLVIFLGVVFSTLLISYRAFRNHLPSVRVLRSQYPVVDYQGASVPTQMHWAKIRPHGWVKISRISKIAVAAIVVSEDWAFYQHKGYDLNQITEAFKLDLKRRRFARGASTITQQVVKNLFLGQEKSLGRKIKEVVLSVQLEETLKKSEILEIYLNIAEWGEGLFGVGAAAQFYFKKDPSDLTAKEGAFLAMLLPSPKRYSRSFFKRRLTHYAQETVQSILDKMVQAGYLSEESRQGLEFLPLSFER